MQRNAEEINEAIRKSIYDLFEIAKFDGSISEDEQAILDQVKIDFEKLRKKLLTLVDSNVSEEEFIKAIDISVQETVDHATKIAEEDDNITFDEEFLINRIQEFIEELAQ